jgi:hypothetical protein
MGDGRPNGEARRYISCLIVRACGCLPRRQSVRTPARFSPFRLGKSAPGSASAPRPVVERGDGWRSDETNNPVRRRSRHHFSGKRHSDLWDKLARSGSIRRAFTWNGSPSESTCRPPPISLGKYAVAVVRALVLCYRPSCARSPGPISAVVRRSRLPSSQEAGPHRWPSASSRLASALFRGDRYLQRKGRLAPAERSLDSPERYAVRADIASGSVQTNIWRSVNSC